MIVKKHARMFYYSRESSLVKARIRAETWKNKGQAKFLIKKPRSLHDNFTQNIN